MKLGVIVSTGVLLFFGIAAPTYAQRDHEQRERGQWQERNRDHQQRGERQERNRERQQRVQRQDRDREQHRGGQWERNRQQRQGSWRGERGQRVQRGHQREMWHQHRARNWRSEHRDWRQRGGYTGYRIPDHRYRAHFGRNHWFRIHSYPIELYGGYPRFRYGGYWFGFVDPWPEYWGDAWYENDDVYIDYYDGGYYLYNRRYPEDRIAVTVYLQ
jgi:hypothetical protein